MTDLLSNQTDFGAYSLSSMLPLIQGKKLRVLAVMTEKRSGLLPDVPTVAELGFQGVDSSIRFGAVRARRHAAGRGRQAGRREQPRHRRSRR